MMQPVNDMGGLAGVRRDDLGIERRIATSPFAYANLSMSTSQRWSASASSSTTSPPTSPPLFTPHPRRPKRAACSGGLSSTTRLSTPAGSTWLRSRSECSKDNVSIVASKAVTGSLPRSTLAVSAKPKRRPNQLDVLDRQGQNQDGACLSRSLAQRVIITVQGN
jgi:hypothetical protein